MQHVSSLPPSDGSLDGTSLCRVPTNEHSAKATRGTCLEMWETYIISLIKQHAVNLNMSFAKYLVQAKVDA
jgi:hypothetical protein